MAKNSLDFDPHDPNLNRLKYPSPGITPPEFTGVFPVDFILETILSAGLEWFRTEPEAPNLVFANLLAPFLEQRYGQAKIDEITAYIKKFDIRIVQHWSLIAKQTPCFSIQILEASEEQARAALDDHKENVDNLDESTNGVLGRTSFGYLPIIDHMHIGIHTIETPDLVKYLYYFAIYILGAFKEQLQDRGLQLTTFRATDISRLNDFLPENMYSRFINMSIFTTAKYKKDELPIITKFNTGVGSGITGLCLGGTTEKIFAERTDSDPLEREQGVTVDDIFETEE